MTGDRLDTDVLFGIKNNIDTCLVFSGVYTPELAKNHPIKSTYVSPSVKEFLSVNAKL